MHLSQFVMAAEVLATEVMENEVTETEVVAAAETVEPNLAFVAIMGLCTVMVGLVCLIAICKLMGLIVGKLVKPEAAQPAAPVPVNTPAQPAQIANRGELVAAISAVIAEELGTDVSAIRILSLKKVDK